MAIAIAAVSSSGFSHRLLGGGEACERAVRQQVDAIERRLDEFGELVGEVRAMIAAVIDADGTRGQIPP